MSCSLASCRTHHLMPVTRISDTRTVPRRHLVMQNLRLAVEMCELAAPLGVDVFVAAARAGALPVCRWLREQRCPWSWDTLGAAMRR